MAEAKNFVQELCQIVACSLSREILKMNTLCIPILCREVRARVLSCNVIKANFVFLVLSF